MNAAAQTIRIVAFSAIVPLALLVAPILTGQLIAEYGLKPENVGTYFLFELGGISLASLPALWWMRRFSSRDIAVTAAAVFVLGNLASMLASSIALLCIARLVTALAGGALMLLCLNAAAQSANRDRVLGYWVTGQLVLGAIGLALLPRLFQTYGLDAFFAVTALLMTLCIPLARTFDAPTIPVRKREGKTTRASIIIFAMLGVMLFYLAVGGVWSFMTLIGEARGIETFTAANIVATASLFGILGAVTASILGGRVGRKALLIGGFLILMLSLFALLAPGTNAFTLSAFGFKFAWTFALPSILAAIASHDNDGSTMSWTNLIIGTGNAIAPMVAGQILRFSGQTSMLLIEATFAMAALAIMLIVNQRSAQEA
jgi:predicted MFS family arabinose efflux permease